MVNTVIEHITSRIVCRWVFGYSNAEAISSGLTGVECRGEEHEVILIWSIASSKRVLRIDGEDIHYSVGRLSDAKFEFSYSIQGGHLLKVTAHLMKPIGSTSEFRQYDLQLDGLSFFEMPRLFQLGQAMSLKEYQAPPWIIESKSPSKNDGQPQTYANYKVENHDVYPDISKSRAVTNASKVTASPMIQDNLLFSPVINTPNETKMTPSVISQPSNLSSGPSLNQPITNNASMGMVHQSNPAPKFMPYQLQAPAANIGDLNGHSPHSVGTMSQPSFYESVQSKSSYDDVRNMILDCYELSSPPSLAYSEELSRSQDSNSLSLSQRENSPTPDMGYYDKTISGYGTTEKSISGYGSNEKVISSYGSANLEEAFRTLVNLENISKPQSQSITSLKQEPQPSLNHMKHSSNVIPIKEVMKPAAMKPYDSAASYGAMVPYGVPTSYSNYMVNPPPLQKVSGFGVGATVSYDTSYISSVPHFWSH